jgi:hypothetical protein
MTSSRSRSTLGALLAGTLASSVPTTAHAAPAAGAPPPRLPASARADAPTMTLAMDRCRQGRRDLCKERRISGAVLTAAGAAVLVAGIALMPFDNQTIDDEPAYQRAYRPAGVVMMGGGLLSLVTGIVLLADAAQRKRKSPRFAWRMR